MKNKLIYILMTMSAFFWSGAFIAGKVSVLYFTPVQATFYRFTFASIIIFTVLKIKEPENVKINKSQIKMAMTLGIVGMIGYHLLFFEALKHTTASNASMIAAMNPMLTALFSSLMVSEKLGLRKISFLALAFLGVILTITNWNIDIILSMQFNIGDLIMMLAVTCWALYAILVKKFMPNFSPLQLSTYSFISCAVLLIPFYAYQGLDHIAGVSARGWLSVLYMAIFATVIGYLIQQISIKKIGASATSIFINLVPIFSIILAFLILGESLSTVKLASGFIIIFSVYNFNKVRA
ncbi:MAG: DMT family transporter [Acidaminobacteraceae bacterium]